MIIHAQHSSYDAYTDLLLYFSGPVDGSVPSSSLLLLKYTPSKLFVDNQPTLACNWWRLVNHLWDSKEIVICNRQLSAQYLCSSNLIKFSKWWCCVACIERTHITMSSAHPHLVYSFHSPLKSAQRPSAYHSKRSDIWLACVNILRSIYWELWIKWYNVLQRANSLHYAPCFWHINASTPLLPSYRYQKEVYG